MSPSINQQALWVEMEARTPKGSRNPHARSEAAARRIRKMSVPFAEREFSLHEVYARRWVPSETRGRGCVYTSF